VASGVRRIEAITGKEFMKRVDVSNMLLRHTAETFRTNRSGLLERVDGVVSEMKELRQTIEQMKDRMLNGDVDHFMMSSRTVGALKVITATRSDLESADLRRLGDFLKSRNPDVVAVLCSTANEKISFLAVCGANAVQAGVKAGDIIKTVTAICGGKGGGKPDSAMGGGTDPLKIDDALAAVDDFVAGKLG